MADNIDTLILEGLQMIDEAEFRIEDFTQFANNVTYDGLDLKELRKKIMHLAIAFALSQTQKITKNPVEEAKRVKDALRNAVTYIKRLLVLFAMRGSKTDAIINKTSEVGKNSIIPLLSALKVAATRGPQKKGAASTLGRDIVTLPRMAACFPILFGKILNAQFVRMPVTAPEGLPRCFCWSGGPSLIPREDRYYDKLMPLWTQWQESFTQLIGAETTPEKQAVFAMAAFHSTLVEEGDRIEFAKEQVRLLVNMSPNLVEQGGYWANFDLS